jgi:hypothetical protein
MEISGGKLATYEESQEGWSAWKLTHSALWDKDNRNHENYGVASWPTAYIVGPDGKVFWEGNPAMLLKREKEVAKLKKLLEEKLPSKKEEASLHPTNFQTDSDAKSEIR